MQGMCEKLSENDGRLLQKYTEECLVEKDQGDHYINGKRDT